MAQHRPSGQRRARRPRLGVVLGLAAVLIASACTTDPDGAASPDGEGDDGGSGRLEVEAISTRPEYVTGGDVLVEVAGVPEGEDPMVTVGGDERVGTLEPTGDGRWRGLVDGLPEGSSTIEVSAGDHRGELEVTDHPVTGPLFSGPHQEPYTCTTVQMDLGEPTDADCTVASSLRWDYFDRDGQLHPLADRARIPDDAATVMVGGTEVPFVVRTETGTINRGVYWISGVDPSPSEDAWQAGPDRWNGDVVHRFGGGCGTSYSQGSTLLGGQGAPTIDHGLLAAGYVVATNTLNTFQVHCNDVLSAETTLMLQEHLAERWGVPDHVIGEGGSGGAIQQLLMVQNYPGILDAVAASAPFPDAMSIAPGVADCGLLIDFYGRPEGADFTEDQRRAVNGHLTTGTCAMWKGTFLAALDPTIGCDLAFEEIYDPATNPDGARCTLQDSNVNLFGRDPRTGFARRPLDNVGVQYGLAALREGAISVDQFLRLNEGIGGYDIDGNVVSERMRGEEGALRHLASTGRVNFAGGDVLRVPMIVVNNYSDPGGDIHDRWRAFSIRERLARVLAGTTGERGSVAPRPMSDTPNMVLWTTSGGSIVEGVTGGRTDTRDSAVAALSGWLDALDDAGRPDDDAPPREWAAALGFSRPAELTDRCVLPDGRTVSGPDVYVGDNECTRSYPLMGDPRTVAGQDLAATTAKCRLSPVDPDSYGVDLTAEQEERLRAAFPEGVCDWSRAGVGEVHNPRTWVSY